MTPYAEMSETARVWIYQADRLFNPYEVISVRGKLLQFIDHWMSHQDKVRGFAEVYHDLFLVFVAEEAEVTVSGCSIDSTVHFVQALGLELGIEFFDRLRVAYSQGGSIGVDTKEKVLKRYDQADPQADFRVFNNLVSSKAEFEGSWLIPLEESWVGRSLKPGN